MQNVNRPFAGRWDLLGPKKPKIGKALFVALVALVAACDRSSSPDVGDQPVSIGGFGDERDCLWTVPFNAGINTMFPDTAATYWLAPLVIPPGGRIRFEGQYPHSRYISFNIYNELLQPLDGANDTEIRPLHGNVNPYDLGANRDVLNRAYAEYLISAVAPGDASQRLPNTLYSSQAAGNASVSSNLAIVLFRNYVPDVNHSAAESLPRIVFELADGTMLTGPGVCSVVDKVVFSIPNVLGQLPDLPLNYLINTSAFKYPLWLKFFDLQSSEVSRLYNTPLGPAVYELGGSPTSGSGGFFSNRDNRYISAAISQRLGNVVALHPKMPLTPKTVDGDPVMHDGDMRYWSLCVNNGDTLAVINCLYDEQVVRDAKGRAVIAVSRAADRPANAIPSCGVTWLDWGVPENGLLIMRNQLVKPESEFPYAIQYVPGPPGAHEAEVMQDYYPYGEHMDKAGFEALGCPVSADALANIVTPPPGSDD